jgi:hypothetical protein
MNTEKFKEAIEKHIGQINSNLLAKAKEYASDADRLHNFNRASGITGECREKALFGFALKHLVSTMDIIDDVNKGKLPTQAMLDEKLGDLGTYIALLHASIQDRLNQ